MEKKRKPRTKREVAQISNIEEREAHLTFDYYEKKVTLYTNNAVVMGRVEKKGFKPIAETTINGKVYGRTYESSFKDMASMISAGVYR